MQDVVGQFQKETGKTVKLVYGSSGNFLQQIQNGAPYDIFLSANVAYVDRLISFGKIDAASVKVYAVGRVGLL